MSLKVEHELVPAGDVLFDTVQEQGIELDLVLPDYCPEVFKIIGCTAKTGITDYNLNGARLTYELCADITVLYYDEKTRNISTVKQKQIYSRSADTGVTDPDPDISICAESDYITCRAVNQRRLDIKGVISVRIRISGDKKTEVICSTEGMNVHSRKRNIEYVSDKLSSVKYLSIDDGLSVPSISGEITGIIRTECIPSASEIKMVSDRIIVKGSCSVRVTYASECDGVQNIGTTVSNIPFSQIIELHGADDTCRCTADVRTVSLEVTADRDKKEPSLSCSISLIISCSISRPSYAQVITDIYSTRYRYTADYSEIKVCSLPEQINDTFNHKVHIECSTDTISKVYDVWCEADNIRLHELENENGKCCLSGNARYYMLFRNGAGEPSLIKKEVPFEYCISESSSQQYEVQVLPMSCSYSLAGESSADLTAEMAVRGRKQDSYRIKALVSADVSSDENEENGTRCALKLYFCSGGESIWDIAKKFGTSEEEIMSANDLSDDLVKEGCMLMVPITR